MINQDNQEPQEEPQEIPNKEKIGNKENIDNQDHKVIEMINQELEDLDHKEINLMGTDHKDKIDNLVNKEENTNPNIMMIIPSMLEILASKPPKWNWEDISKNSVKLKT